MRLFITGASGLLGSKIAELAVKRGHLAYSGYNTHKPIYGNRVKVDVSSKESCLRAFQTSRPEAVIHAAALTNVDLCETNKELAWKVNVLGTRNIAELCRRWGTFLVYVSTDYVFKGDKGLYSEEDKPSPINYYGLTKLRGEVEVKNTLDKWCICRGSVIFGSRPAAGKVNFALWVIESLKNNKKINIVTDQINSPTLNSNLARMILEVVERELTGIYHLAGATPISRYDFAKLLARKFDLDGSLIIPTTSDKINWIAKRPKNTSLDVSRAKRNLHNKPMEITEAIKELKDDLIRMKLI